ncbi:MAG: hypothetical protein AAF939_09670 [Planctomycetota bacterium]
MTRLTCLSSAILLAICFTNSSVAQFELFSGRGVDDSLMNGTTETTEPGLSDFSFGEPPRLFNFRNREGGPLLGKLFGQGQSKGVTGEPTSGFSIPTPRIPSLAEFFPPRDPSRQSILETINLRSKDFVDRTTAWAQQQNDRIKARTFETWDSITRGFNRTSQSLSEVKPIFPRIGRTNEAEGTAKLRF